MPSLTASQISPSRVKDQVAIGVPIPDNTWQACISSFLTVRKLSPRPHQNMRNSNGANKIVTDTTISCVLNLSISFFKWIH